MPRRRSARAKRPARNYDVVIVPVGTEESFTIHRASSLIGAQTELHRYLKSEHGYNFFRSAYGEGICCQKIWKGGVINHGSIVIISYPLNAPIENIHAELQFVDHPVDPEGVIPGPEAEIK